MHPAVSDSPMSNRQRDLRNDHEIYADRLRGEQLGSIGKRFGMMPRVVRNRLEYHERRAKRGECPWC
jgi:hypothetical protein